MSPDALDVVVPDEAVGPSQRLGSLPQGWCSSTLGEVASINPATAFDSLADDAEIPFVPMIAVAEETGILDISRRRLVAEIRKGYVRFCEGDVIFAKITPCMENGKTAPVMGIPGGYAAGSTEFHVLRPRAVDTRYLWYWLVRHAFRHEAERKMSGSAGQLRVPAEYLRNSPISLAPLPEQRRIVARIDELFAEIAEGEAALNRARQGLDAWRRALLKAAVTGELTRDWRAANRPAETGAGLLARIRAERAAIVSSGRTSRPEGALDSDAPSVPGLPDGWARAPFADFIAKVEAGLNVKALGRPPEVDETGIVKVSAVTWGEFDELASKTLPREAVFDEADIIRPGDFLFSRANTLELVGAPVIVKHCARKLVLSDKVLRVRLIGGIDRWIEIFLKSPHGRAQIEAFSTGNQLSMRNISQENIKKIVIPLPPEGELHVLIEVYDLMERAAAEATQDMCRLAATEQSMRQSILKAAFEGRLVPQNPGDEPASELLARLRVGNAGAHASRGRRGRKRNGAEAFELPLFTARADQPSADAG